MCFIVYLVKQFTSHGCLTCKLDCDSDDYCCEARCDGCWCCHDDPYKPRSEQKGQGHEGNNNNIYINSVVGDRGGTNMVVIDEAKKRGEGITYVQQVS